MLNEAKEELDKINKTLKETLEVQKSSCKKTQEINDGLKKLVSLLDELIKEILNESKNSG